MLKEAVKGSNVGCHVEVRRHPMMHDLGCDARTIVGILGCGSVEVVSPFASRPSSKPAAGYSAPSATHRYELLSNTTLPKENPAHSHDPNKDRCGLQ